MQKIITLFQRNYETDHLVRDEVTPGAEWVLDGQGTATRKFDGTCCLVRAGKLYKRYEAKQSDGLAKLPAGFELAGPSDPVTGKIVGWVPVGTGPNDKWHREAWEGQSSAPQDGTYELVGPKVQGNHEGFDVHVLVPHGFEKLIDVPRDFEGLKEFLRTATIEGIVWHHPDGRMVKIKKRDFFKK